MDAQLEIEFKLTPEVRKEIVKLIDERIREAHVTKEDFSELKDLVRTLTIKVGELAQAQKRTEEKVEALAEAQRSLAEAQKRTEEKVEALAEAQKNTEKEIKKLTVALNLTRRDLGGLERSFSYAFENEAYRHLPRFLKDKYGLVIKERMIRAEIGGKEINFFAKAERDGKEVLVVGEAKTRLDTRQKGERRDDPIRQLNEKVQAVIDQYGDVEIVKLLVTHFATQGFLKKAQKEGILVVQSYEW